MSKQTIDWLQLTQFAKDSASKAYAPYSNFAVGAAAYTQQGTIVQGCNVENASYGLTICAERNCIAQAIIKGERQFTAMVIYTEQIKLTAPCGACRQVIAEFFEPTAQIMAANHLGDKKQWTVAELLPDAFSPKDLLDK